MLGPAPAAFKVHSRDVSILAKQEDDLESMMAEDMQQFAAKPASKDMPSATTAGPEASKGGLKDVLDKVSASSFADRALRGYPCFYVFGCKNIKCINLRDEHFSQLGLLLACCGPRCRQILVMQTFA